MLLGWVKRFAKLQRTCGMLATMTKNGINKKYLLIIVLMSVIGCTNRNENLKNSNSNRDSCFVDTISFNFNTNIDLSKLDSFQVDFISKDARIDSSKKYATNYMYQIAVPGRLDCWYNGGESPVFRKVDKFRVILGKDSFLLSDFKPEGGWYGREGRESYRCELTSYVINGYVCPTGGVFELYKDSIMSKCEPE